MSETKEEPFVVNQKNLKSDMIHFKDDVLKDMKNLQRDMTEKFDMTNNLIKEKFDSYDRKFNLYSEKIAQISNLLVTVNDLKDKMEKLVQGKLDLRDHILTNEVKFTNLEKEFHEKIEKIEYILNDSVIYPSVIGPKGKYKTFHEFIDYVLQQLAQTAIFRDKNSFDLSSYKNKLENLIQSFKFQLDNIIKSTNQFTTKSVNECEERVKGMLILYDDRLTDVRVENQNYIKDLEVFFRDLKEDIKKLNAMKNGIYNRFSNEVFNMKRDNVQVVKIFGNYKKEFNEMKDKLTKLAEFIKDIRFRINIGQEIKRREFINMANRIDFSKKQDDNISSGVRKYIKGEINADELAQTRRFTKSNINLQNINNTVNNKKINNNNYNLDEDFEDSMNSINNYLAKNNYFDPDYNNNNYSNQKIPAQTYVSPDYLNAYRRKSVNNLISGISLKNFKNNAQMLNKNQNLRKTLNTSNNDLKGQNNNINNINFSKSLDKGRKRYQSVVSGNFNSYDNYMNLQNFDMKNNKNNANINAKKSNSMDSEDSKNSKEGINYDSNNNLPKNVIREEDELGSKVSENESNYNKSGLDEEKIKSNKANNKNDNKDNSKLPNNISPNTDNNIQLNINQNNIAVIKPVQNNEKENNLNKPMLGHSGNISLSTMKSLSKPKEIQKSDKKPNNNIVIDCDTKNLNRNKESNASSAIEKNLINNNSEANLDKSNVNNISVIKKDIPKNNNNDYLPNYNLLSISSYKNPLSNSETKTIKNNFNNSNIKSIPQTSNFSAKKENKSNTLQPLNVDKKINTISVGTEYKSFKGKKYDISNLSFIAKINESSIPYESQINSNNFRPKNSNKKLLPKMNDKYISNNNYNLLFGQDEERPKHYKNGPNNNTRNNEAKNIQRMVNDLQSYITNYSNIADDKNSINNMYKNGQNFIFKEMNNSYLGNNYNNQPSNNSNQKIRKNIFQLKLK